jgi:hypothetical protein
MNNNTDPITIRMINGISEVVLNGERFYRVMTGPTKDGNYVTSLFTNAIGNELSTKKDIKSFIFEEPYYNFKEVV